jgi:N-acetylneuraminate synthase/N,N'-diacetyllegionaminate synthase
MTPARDALAAVQVAHRAIGAGEPCFIAAEIGINHNGDMALARQMIDAAADAGADAVKFQNYRTEDFLSDKTLTYEYESQGRRVVESQYDMFKRCELTAGDLAGLARHCAARGLMFFSTPTSEQGIADAQRAGAPLLKNGSDYLSHLPLVRAMARSGLPTVLSTGMATLAEIEDAVLAYRDAGGRGLVLLACTSAYPTPDEDVNLARIAALRTAFGCPVGFSDHTWGAVAATAAVALGACFVEKHFTVDRGLPGPDQRFSSDPQEFRELVQSIRRAERCIGSAAIGPTPSETEARRGYRLSCVAASDLGAGHRLRAADIAFRRPANGLPPKLAPRIEGRRLGRGIVRGHVFDYGDFDD